MASEQRVLLGYLLAVSIVITAFAFPIASSLCQGDGSGGNSSDISNVHSNLCLYVNELETISGFSNEVSKD